LARIEDQIAGLLLAGGRSRRFGSDKADAQLGGTSLLARGIARLKPQVGSLAISANAPASLFADYGLPVLADDQGDEVYAGPLAGVLAGLDWALRLAPTPRWLLTAAVDTPFFPENLADRLAAAVSEGDQMAIDRIVMASSASGTHPTFALWPLPCRDALSAYLAGGGRKLHDWMRRQEAVSVVFPETRIGSATIDPFFNINTKEDLSEAAQLLLAKPGDIIQAPR
jgi:molybdopterin-guanine dinucleotide biosynthesis protein A